MKRLHYFVAACVLAWACNQQHDTFCLQLSTADSLMKTDADSALHLLYEMEPVAKEVPEELGMEYLLLKCNALNKVGQLPQNDSIGLELVEYYDHNGTANQRMLAYYILGSIYRDTNDLPSALRCYNNAVEVADTSDSECNLYQLSIIYGQIGDIYLGRYVMEDALEALTKAIGYARLSGNDLCLYCGFKQIGQVYMYQGKYQLALDLYEKAAEGLDSIGYGQLALAIRLQSVERLSRSGNRVKARRYLDDYRKNSGYFLPNGDIEEGREDYYYSEGTYYLLSESLDSAEYFFRKLMRTGKLMNDKYLAAWGLSQLYKERVVSDSVAKYAYMGDVLGDTLYDEKVAQTMLHSQAMYDYSRYERMAQRKECEAKEMEIRMLHKGYLVVVLLFIIVLLLWKYRKSIQMIRLFRKRGKETDILLRKHKKLMEQCVREKEDAIERLRREGEELTKEMNVLLSRLSKNRQNVQQIKESNRKVVEQLQEEKNEYEQRIRMLQSRLWAIELRESTPVARICEIAKKREEHPTSKEWEDATKAIEQRFPCMGMIKEIKNIGPVEYRTCLLLKAEIGLSDIVYLMNTDHAKLAMLRMRMLAKICNMDGKARDFDSYLRQLL